MSSSPRDPKQGAKDPRDLKGLGDPAGLAARTPTQDLAARTPTQDLAARTPTQDLAARTPTQDLAARTPTQDLAARTPTQDLAARTPPGQTLTKKWPVLHYSGIPLFYDLSKWRFKTLGEVDEPLDLTLEQFKALPSVTTQSDFHCVTTWSRLDNVWQGVLFKTIAERTRVRKTARHCLIHGYDGYTTNVPLATLLDDDVLFPWSHDGKPLSEEHGGPLRLVVPKLYAWKSAKWVGAVEFLAEDQRGYWEQRGYHNRGEPFAEERYSYQETD